MIRTLIALSALALVPLSAPAQTLAHSLPADTLVYFRQTDPLGTFQRVGSSDLLWNNPVDIQKDFLDGIDKMLGMADGFLGIEVGSLSTYLRSIKSFEGALYRFELTDGFPEIEFALVFQTPMADKIYKLLSGKLVEEQIGEDLGNNETEVRFGDDFGLNVAQHEDKIVIANDQRRLRETMKTFGTTVAGCLAQDPRFKTALGDGTRDNCLYGRVDHFLKTLQDESPRFMRFGEGRMVMAVAQSLGLFKLSCLGFAEEPTHTRFSLLSNGPIPAFEILAADGGKPDLLHAMPADTVFGFAWCGDSVNLWKRASGFLLDKEKFPMAPMVEEGIRTFQLSSGVKAEELATVAQGGAAFGFIPDSQGQLDDNPDNFFFMFKPGDTAKAKELVVKLAAIATKRRGGELVTEEEAGVSWYRVKRAENEENTFRREMPSLALLPDIGIVAVDSVARKLIGIRTGQYPSLGGVASTKGLKPGAAAYLFFGMKAVLAQENEFSTGYHAMKDGAGIAASIEIQPDRFLLTTNQPMGQVLNAFALAGVSYESQDDQRNAIRADLKKIADAYRLYRGQNNKDPATLAELGFTGDKALAYPPNRAAGDPGKPYVLLQVGTVGADMEYSTIVAHAPDARFGRLVATLDGSAGSWSEARFQRTLARQKEAALAPPPPAPVPGK